ncbi:hypothetical protein [Methylovulum miyakonense]|uniref:hypothetical protein n=1 Tax=Methylovulum miyakonense TaxID=645578 RepID=UPI00036DC0F2|nr:hypothetical protein [Methylovulum miyakonense]
MARIGKTRRTALPHNGKETNPARPDNTQLKPARNHQNRQPQTRKPNRQPHSKNEPDNPPKTQSQQTARNEGNDKNLCRTKNLQRWQAAQATTSTTRETDTETTLLPARRIQR